MRFYLIFSNHSEAGKQITRQVDTSEERTLRAVEKFLVQITSLAVQSINVEILVVKPLTHSYTESF